MQSQNNESSKGNFKYGKPSQEELKMEVYAPDSTAEAVVLFHTGVSEFDYTELNGFRIKTTHRVRLKILKPEGFKRANVTLSYYAPDDRTKEQDNILYLEASAYNLENGKTVKTEMNKEFVSRERVSEYTRILKLSIPAVKVGTVIEYSYTFLTEYFHNIDNWEMQEDIPVMFSQYQITVPKIFIYNIEMRGKEYIDVKEKEASIRVTTKVHSASTSDVVAVQSRAITFTGKNLPAIKQDETHIWCPEDYKVQISFELEGTQFPGSEYKSYTKTWADIDRHLFDVENDYFGKHLSLDNPFREETRAIYSDEFSFNEKISRALRLVKSKVAWNGKYQLYGLNPLKAIEKGSGTNAEINLLLIAVLKDLGMKSHPTVLRLRNRGVLPFNYPSIQKLNTFILAIENVDEGQYVFIDASMNTPMVNILPEQLLVDKARILNMQETEEKRWANLTTLTSNSTRVVIQASITPEEIKGTKTSSYIKQEVTTILRERYKATDQSNYITQLGNRLNCKISNYKFNEPNYSQARMAESFEFTQKVNRQNDRIYVHPMIFRHLTDNPFTQVERNLPVEFPYPSVYTINAMLQLPEGYVVEELPQSQSIQIENGGLSLKYIIQQTGNQLSLQYSFNLRDSYFTPQQYVQLQKVWSAAIEKSNAFIVLKKQ